MISSLSWRKWGSSPYYLHVYDGWLSASTVEGPWSQITASPAGLDDVGQQLAESGQVDLLDGGNAQPKPALSDGVPTIYASHVPAELLVFKGPPDFQPITGTSLLWATNTTADVLVNTADNRTYVLLSGRWYNAPSLNAPGATWRAPVCRPTSATSQRARRRLSCSSPWPARRRRRKR